MLNLPETLRLVRAVWPTHAKAKRCGQETQPVSGHFKRKCANTFGIQFTLICLSLLCSCATMRDSAGTVSISDWPSEVVLNPEAGREMLVFVVLRLENGREVPCVVDTGAPGSLLPKSFETILGKRLGKMKIRTLDSRTETVNIYASPKMYLGPTLLATASRIGTWDGPFGVLGMDCLRHYCIQLDFEARRLRFLPPESVNAAELGKAFPLFMRRYVYIESSLLDHRGKALIDTGCLIDGFERGAVFKREIRKHQANGAETADHGPARFPHCVWDGETYSDLMIGQGESLIGLRFLGRHRVTLNFPGSIMYLERNRSSSSKNP